MAPLARVQDTLILVGPSWTAVTSLGGEVPRVQYVGQHSHLKYIPSSVISAESEKAVFATVHL